MAIYKDDTHKIWHGSLMSGMQSHDCYHDAIAYLIALDQITRKHWTDIFDIENDCIKCDALTADWQTSTTLKICRFAFNLWNGCYYDNNEPDRTCRSYAADFIFDTDYMTYFFEAVKIRFNAETV